MNQHIAESDDARRVGNVRQQIRIDLCKPPERLADDFELTLDARAQQGVSLVSLEAFATAKFLDQPRRLAHVEQEFSGLRLHRRVAWSLRPIA